MDWVNEIGAWAWARHHNPLSWYIRPLFLVPYAYFAWRRSVPGIAGTLVALATSMAWFPAPEHPEPRVEAFLAMEKHLLLGPLDASKVAGLLAVPAALGALALAFWRHSVKWGIAMLVAIAATKMTWSIVGGGAAGWSVATPALVGLVICVGAVLGAHRFAARRKP